MLRTRKTSITPSNYTDHVKKYLEDKKVDLSVEWSVLKSKNNLKRNLLSYLSLADNPQNRNMMEQCLEKLHEQNQNNEQMNGLQMEKTAEEMEVKVKEGKDVEKKKELNLGVAAEKKMDSIAASSATFEDKEKNSNVESAVAKKEYDAKDLENKEEPKAAVLEKETESIAEVLKKENELNLEVLEVKKEPNANAVEKGEDSIAADNLELNVDVKRESDAMHEGLNELKKNMGNEEVAENADESDKAVPLEVNTEMDVDMNGDDDDSPIPEVFHHFQGFDELTLQKSDKSMEERVPIIQEMIEKREMLGDSRKRKAGERKNSTSSFISDRNEGGELSIVENTAGSTPIPAKKAKRAGASTGRNRGGRVSVVDISNPIYKEPLNQGWVRELVYRSLSDDSSKRQADIYYYTPSKKKVRSIRELVEYLPQNGSLTASNFTFWKEPLNVNDPEKEIIRDAKTTYKRDSLLPKDKLPYELDVNMATATDVDGKVPPLTLKKSKRPIKRTQMLGFDGDEWETMASSEDGSPNKGSGTGGGNSSKTKISTKPTTGIKVKLPVFKGDKGGGKPKRMLATAATRMAAANNAKKDLEMGTLPLDWKDSIAHKSQGMVACSVHCTQAKGLIPTLQCIFCLCLYHLQCCGLPPNRNVTGYICKNCQVKRATPKKSPLADKKKAAASATRKKIVDGVTTWLPPSSNIQLPTNSNNKNLVTITPIPNTCAPVAEKPASQSVVEVNVVAVGAEVAGDGGHNAAASLVLVPLSGGDGISHPQYVMANQDSSRLNGQPNCSKGGTCSGSLFPAMDMSRGGAFYTIMVKVLSYLKVQELLQVAKTSKFLRSVSSDSSLWRYVHMKNSCVRDWKGFENALNRLGTRKLDLNKMLIPNNAEDLAAMWENMCDALSRIPKLEEIYMCRCEPKIVEKIAKACPKLKILHSLFMKNVDVPIDPTVLGELRELQELKLKGHPMAKLALEKGVKPMLNLKNLQILSLTNTKLWMGEDLEIIGKMEWLIQLELGDCVDLNSRLEPLIKLKMLTRLRLEKVENCHPAYEFFKTIRGMPALRDLELVNADVKEGFDAAVMKNCKRIKNFFLIPTYVQQSATTNALTMKGVKEMQFLENFFWGLPLELIKVTRIFGNKYKHRRGSGDGELVAGDRGDCSDCIPVLKMKQQSGGGGEKAASNEGSSVSNEVDILPVKKLEQMMKGMLPNSNVKIVVLPNSNMWKCNLYNTMLKPPRA